MDAAVDHGSYLSFSLSEFIEYNYKATTVSEGLIPIVPPTDCKSLYDLLTKEGLPSSTQEKRLAIDIAALGETALEADPEDHYPTSL